jgi:hypothetical protein
MGNRSIPSGRRSAISFPFVREHATNQKYSGAQWTCILLGVEASDSVARNLKHSLGDPSSIRYLVRHCTIGKTALDGK